MEGLSQEFFIKKYSINVDFPDNETKEITTAAYLLSITKIKNSSHA